MLTNITNGTRVGTGANIDIELGYLPSKVELYNVTTNGKLEYVSSMATGTGILTPASAAGPAAVVAPAGVTPLNSTFQGFRIGASAINAAGQTIHWIAYRNGPGSGR